MNSDCIENVRVLASINKNSVSEQDLKILGTKYNLSDAEMQKLNQYCRDNGIVVYDEEEMACVSDDRSAAQSTRKPDQIDREGKREKNRQVSFITKRIMCIAKVRARKRVNSLGWLCGTYANSVERSVERNVRRTFSSEEMKYIIDHLTDFDEEECFAMEDQQSPETCNILNHRLNELIPRLHLNRLNSDLFDDD